MPEYNYVFEMWDPDAEPVDIPENAIGVTVDSFSDYATVRYLVPIGGPDA